ncbi:hypothetical protein Tco_1399313 [Tanacetum coccineum]
MLGLYVRGSTYELGFKYSRQKLPSNTPAIYSRQALFFTIKEDSILSSFRVCENRSVGGGVSGGGGSIATRWSDMIKLLSARVKEEMCEDGLSAIATKLGTPLMLDSYTSDMCIQSWGRSSYARVLIELRADVELKDYIVVAMPKITRVGHYTCNVRIEYEWKPPRSSSGWSGNRFQTSKKYRHVPKKPNASSSGNKKKCVEPTIEVRNSNQFDVLNSVDNDVDFGTNGGTTNLVNNGATSSRSSFMNVDKSSSGTTPTIDKIGKFEDLLTRGKAILVDKAGNP